MRDFTDYIITFILVTMCGLMVYGYWDYDRREVRDRLEREEQQWKWAVWHARGIRCFRAGYLELYVVGDTLQTVRAESAFTNCMK